MKGEKNRGIDRLYLQEIWEILEALPLSEEQRLLASDYILEDKREEEILGFAFQDLSDTSIHYADITMKGLPKEEAKRLFQVLFQIGASTCAGMFSVSGLERINQEKGLGIEAEQLLALRVQTIKEKQLIDPSFMAWAMEITKGQAEVVLGAIAYNKGTYLLGKLFLLAVYFLLQYPNLGMDTCMDGSGADIGIRREEQVLKEDKGLLEEYKGILLEQLDGLFLEEGSSQVLPEELVKIVKGLQEEELSKEIRALVKGKMARSFYMELIAGYAFIHFDLSVCLKNLVVLCREIREVDTWKAMEQMDYRKRVRTQGECFKRLFGFHAETYIFWAAERGYKEVLKEQFFRERESYLECCKIEDLERMLQLYPVIKETDPVFYQKWIEVEWRKQKEKIVERMEFPAPVVDRIKEYLLREIGVQQFLVYRPQLFLVYRERLFRTNYFFHLYGSQMEQYEKLVEEDHFFNRCQVCMLFCLEKRFFQSWFTENRLEKKRLHQEHIKRTFEAFDAEGVKLADQLWAVRYFSYELYHASEEQEEFLETAQEIFRVYLAERAEQTLEAFFQAGSYGRYFALLVLAFDAEKYKDSILRFSGDNVKLVKEQFISILSKQRGWEAEVKAFLASKKAKERELAVLVLSAWGREQDRQELKKAWEKERSKKLRVLLEEILQKEEGLQLEGNGLGTEKKNSRLEEHKFKSEGELKREPEIKIEIENKRKLERK